MKNKLKKKINIKLVATPDNLSENIRTKLDYLDAKTFPGELSYPKDGCYWWIAYLDKETVGFAGLKPLKGSNKKIGFLCRAGVLSVASGQGIQRRFIKLRLDKARELGLSEVITYTYNKNYRSAANLLRSGLKFYTPQTNWAGISALYFHYVFFK